MGLRVGDVRAVRSDVPGALSCEYASLDHDLGDSAEDGGDGYKLVLWMAEHDRWPTQGIRVHSANAPGMKRMLADIDHYSPFRPTSGITRGDWPDPIRTPSSSG